MPRYLKDYSARTSAGFTLLEVLIAIAVAGIALAIAIPSFTSIITANQLSATANELIGSLNQARMQAVKLNVAVQFCSDSAISNGSDALGATCNSQTGAVYASNVSSPLVVAPQLPANITISHITAIRFGGNGLATTAAGNANSGLIADVYTTKVKSNNHRCIYLITGSVISSCKVTANAGGCPVLEPPSCQQQ